MKSAPVFGLFAVSLATSLSAQTDLRLIPQPREMTVNGAPVSVTNGITIARPANPEDRFAASDLTTALKDRGIRVVTGESGPGSRVVLLRADASAAKTLLRRHSLTIDSTMREEGYAIIPDGNRLVVIGATSAGVFYGAQTVKQLVSGDGDQAKLYRATIRDWPAMRYRGFHDDISRGPVPTLDFQKKQIRTLAAYKVNFFSPYFEHTLSYDTNPLIAPPGGAMTRADVKELIAYAANYHVDIIPEQEAFGHLHHVLKYEIYSPLGETPHGHVLAPGQPGSLPLIRQMFAEINSLFPSRFVHLGADETFELGRGQTADRVKSVGIGVVYLDFLRQIADALRPSGKKFLFWGDVALSSPELVSTIPRDLIAVPWTYGADTSYGRFIKPFRDVGMETWVAPGVSSWNRVYPNNANALVNIQRFVRDGQRLGATGMINTSWDDDGEALFNQTWYGVLFGAAAAWQSGESSIDAFASSYGRVFHGDLSGKIDEAQRRLSAAHALLSNAKVGDASDYLFWLDPWTEEGRGMAQRIRPYTHDLRILAESTLVLIAQAEPGITRERDAIEAMKLGARRMDFIGMKFQFADEVVAMYDRAADTTSKAPQRDLADITGTNGRLQDLRDGLSLIRDEYEKAWLKENRPYWLHNVLARYDLATQLWIGRAERVTLARQEWNRSRKLPPAASLGIPASMPGLAQSQAPLTDYQGVYAYHNGTTLIVVPTDTKLFAVIDEAKYPLRSIGGDRFVNSSGDTIPFRRASTGAVSGFAERGVFFERRASTVDASVAAAVRAVPRPLGRDGKPATYRYTAPADLGDGISVGDAGKAGFDTADIVRLVERVIDGTHPDVHSILAYRGGKLVIEEYFYEYDRDRPHQMRSASKSVESALVGIAIDRGAIASDTELVTRRLPYTSYANPDSRKDALALRDLLTMQSGLACDDWNGASPGNESKVYQSEDWVKFVLDLPMAANPGTKGSYCSGNVKVAGRLVELATGKSLPVFAQQYLFEPLGIRARDVRWNYTLSSSNSATFAQLYMRPRDMLKFGILFQQQGRWKGRQVISRDWVARSTGQWSTVGDQKYGYFWWHQWVMAAAAGGPRRVDTIVATGNGGQKIYIVPSLDLIVVLTGGNYNVNSPATAIMAKDLVPALLR